MCDEYYDERMRAFWRDLAEQDEANEREDEIDAPVVMPLAPEPADSVRRKAKPLFR